MQLGLNIAMARPLDTMGERLRFARQKRHLTQGQLADKAGMKQPDISKIELGSILQTTGIARLARALSVPAEWLERGDGPEPDWSDQQHPSGGTDSGGPLAQEMSHPLPIIDIPTLEWESIMSAGVLQKFQLQVRDDAMSSSESGSLEPGDFAVFDRARPPRPGKNVLLMDRTGYVCIRRYREIRPGHWLAEPTNPNYKPMDSIADGLIVIAAQTGHHY